MAKHQLRNTELDVHRILDGPVRLASAYGTITVPQGHFVINFPGEFELSTALPPDAFMEMFDLSDDERAEWGLPKADDEGASTDGDTNPPTKMTPTSTGPDAVVGVGGDYPPDRPDTLPQSPAAGSSIGPAAMTPQGVYPPSRETLQAWVDAHYEERYRKGVMDKLNAKPMRAVQLLERYPVADAGANEPPAADTVDTAPIPDQPAADQTPAEPPDAVQMVGTTPTEQIPGATETSQPPPASGPPADQTGEGSLPTPTAQPGDTLTGQDAPPVAPNQSSTMQPTPGADTTITPDPSANPDLQTNIIPQGPHPGPAGTPPTDAPPTDAPPAPDVQPGTPTT